MQRNDSDCRGEKKARPVDSGWADVNVHSSKSVMHTSLAPVLFVTLLNIQDCFTCLATLVKQRTWKSPTKKGPKTSQAPNRHTTSTATKPRAPIWVSDLVDLLYANARPLSIPSSTTPYKFFLLLYPATSHISLQGSPDYFSPTTPNRPPYTMAWQPSEQGLQEVLGMLRDTSSVDSEVQRNVAQRLEQLRFVPDFLAYLAHVLIHCTGEQDSHRAVAGLLLKNSLNQRSGPTTNENDARAMAYVKNTVLTGLADPDQIVRQTVGTVIMCLISNEDVGAWPEALDALTKGMGSTDPNVVEVCAARPFYCGRASSNS